MYKGCEFWLKYLFIEGRFKRYMGLFLLWYIMNLEFIFNLKLVFFDFIVNSEFFKVRLRY